MLPVVTEFGSVVGTTVSPSSAWAGATWVYASAPGAPRPGVGSKGTQPTPAK